MPFYSSNFAQVKRERKETDLESTLPSAGRIGPTISEVARAIFGTFSPAFHRAYLAFNPADFQPGFEGLRGG
jgi:hypothetical protein